MKKLFLFASAIFLSIAVYSQQSIQKGRIILTNKTLDGYISTSTYDETPQEFKFSEQKEGKLTTVNNADIKRVEYEDGTIYERHYVSVSFIAKGYIERTPENYRAPFKGERFVQKLLSGPVSLYYLNDNYYFPHFFYKTENSTQLTYLVYQPYINDNGGFVANAQYKNEISFLLQQNSCSKITTNDIDRLEYVLGGMISFFKKVNSCLGTVATNHFTRQSATKINFGIIIGATDNSIDVKAPYYKSKTKWKTGIDPLFGVYVSFAPKRNLKAYNYGIGFRYYSFKAETDSIIFPPFSYSNMKGHAEVSLIELCPYFRYFISDFKAKPFIELGVNYPLKLKSEVVFKSKFGEELRKSYGRTSLFLGAGVDYERFSLKIEYGVNFSPDDNARYLGLIAMVSVFK